MSSAKHPVRYTERFTVTYNRGPVRVEQEMEMTVDLATIRRLMGLYACTSKGRKSRGGYVVVKCVSEPGIVDKSSSHRSEVAIG